MLDCPARTISQRAYIGVDPGSTGALAYLCGRDVLAFPVPTLANAPGGRAVDDYRLIELVHGLASLGPAVAALEQVWGIAGQSASGSHVFGDTAGAIRLTLKCHGIRVEDVPASRWRTALGVHGDKAQSIAAAKRIFPEHAGLFTPVRKVRTLRQCEGNAEACLIAEYARRKWPS